MQGILEEVNFGADNSAVRRYYGPQKLSLLKKMVLNLIRAEKSLDKKCSLAMKRKRAAWKPDRRVSTFGLAPL